MADLFNTPELHVRQLSSQLDFEYSDAEGELLAKATQVSGPRPKGGALAWFAGSPLKGELSLQVTAPDGAPLFGVHRFEGRQRPVVLTAPDGTEIGRRLLDAQASAQSMLEGWGTTGHHRFQDFEDLLDPQGNRLCRIAWEAVRTGTDAARGGRYCLFLDQQGDELARVDRDEATFYKDRYKLTLRRPLPEPLRTLVIASPLATDLDRT
ncbi:hypothetical protein ACIBF1_04570 [Spirillospora sp. NPDC050679]